MKKQLILILIFAMQLMISNCDLSSPSAPVRNNPIDPNNPNFTPPKSTILSGPEEGETIETAEASFTWTGNQPSSEFSYRLNEDSWSEWNKDTLFTFTFLDENINTFEVKSRYPTGQEEEIPQARTFIVDAVKGPALTFFKRHIHADMGDNFKLEIVAEEVTNLFAASVEISFDPGLLKVVSIIGLEGDNEFFKSNGGDVVSFSNFDNETGNVQIDIGVAGGSPPGVTGSGGLSEIQFEALRSGQLILRISTSSQMRDPDNNSIIINQLAEGLVEIN